MSQIHQEASLCLACSKALWISAAAVCLRLHAEMIAGTASRLRSNRGVSLSCFSSGSCSCSCSCSLSERDLDEDDEEDSMDFGAKSL
jgi:hypothetical protein